jgi:hypothetical protein
MNVEPTSVYFSMVKGIAEPRTHADLYAVDLEPPCRYFRVSRGLGSECLFGGERWVLQVWQSHMFAQDVLQG